MKYIATLILTLYLAGCGEGVKMEPEEVDSWFIKNENKIGSIVNDFRLEPCLRRVELQYMENIRQNCELTPELEKTIKGVQSKIEALNVVLATGFRTSDGEFSSSILINRKGIAVSGSGLAIDYWSNIGPHWKQEIECGQLIPLSKDGWYARLLTDVPSCASNKSSKKDALKRASS